MNASTINPQIIKGDCGGGVFVTISEFRLILDNLEELEDIQTVNAFEAREGKEFMPFKQALQEIRANLVK